MTPEHPSSISGAGFSLDAHGFGCLDLWGSSDDRPRRRAAQVSSADPPADLRHLPRRANGQLSSSSRQSSGVCETGRKRSRHDHGRTLVLPSPSQAPPRLPSHRDAGLIATGSDADRYAEHRRLARMNVTRTRPPDSATEPVLRQATHLHLRQAVGDHRCGRFLTFATAAGREQPTPSGRDARTASTRMPAISRSLALTDQSSEPRTPSA